ncbi:MAG: WG repeat-containing protein [Lewinellaceae bacterium]|nr:WG repeat-containing protein [Lewinellaceae bacterium]
MYPLINRMFFLTAFLLVNLSPVFSQPDWIPPSPLEFEYINTLQGDRLGVKVKGLFALADPSGKLLTAPAYKMIFSLGEDLYGYQDPTSELWGILKANGQIATPPRFSKIESFSEGRAVIQRKTQTGAYARYDYNQIDVSGREQFAEYFYLLDKVSEGLIAFRRDSLWGYMMPDGKTVISPKYSYASVFRSGLAAVKVPGKGYGYIDKKGNWVVEPQFDVAEPFVGDFARVAKLVVVGRGSSRRDWGLIDRQGKLILPMENHSIYAYFPNQGFFVQKTEKEYYFLNIQGKITNSTPYDNLTTYTDDGLIRFRQGKVHGMLDNMGKVIIPAVFDELDDFHEGLAAAKYQGKWGFINLQGEVVIPYRYDGAFRFRDGRAIVANNGEVLVINKQQQVLARAPGILSGAFLTASHLFFRQGNLYALVDESGKLIRYLPYDQAGDFQDGLAAVKKLGKYGFINSQATEVITCQYSATGGFYEGLAFVQKSSDSPGEVINTQGATVFAIPAGYQFVGPFSEGLAKIAKSNLGGFIDKTGKIIVEPKYIQLGNFKSGRAIVVNAQGKQGFIDPSGKEIVTPIYDQLGDYSPEGLSPFRKGTSWGFLNLAGGVAIEPTFEVVGTFSNGIAPVKSNGKVGYIDTKGKWVVPALFEDGKTFLDDLAAVKMGGKWGFANTKGNGKLVIDAKYDAVSAFAEGLAWVKTGDKVGAIDRRGTLVIPFSYDEAGAFTNGFSTVKKGGKLGLVNSQGKEIIPPICESLGTMQNGQVILFYKGSDGYGKVALR